jgi:predicted CopG family antitoxin
MSKQTAVEWVIEQYINKNRGLEVFMKAIQMEKEQIIEAYNEGNKHNGWALKHEAEKYYNETYKNEEK